MKKINRILIKKFVIYAKNNLLLILIIAVNIYIELWSLIYTNRK